MVEEKLRYRFDYFLAKAEVGIYSVLAVLLWITILAAIAGAGKLLWNALSHWTILGETFQVLNELLVILMLVEILHTVRISIRSHVLVTEPFLVVGLIASIRRILVISLEMATRTAETSQSPQSQIMFRSAMIELGVLGLLVFILVYSITLLRRNPPPPDLETQMTSETSKL
jgi:uncharacterized membrane protein (DUF373 family)